MYVTTYLFWAFASCRLRAYSAHTRCESMNSLSHGITYLQVQDRVHSLWVNELTLPRHHISTSTRQSSFTVSQWTHSPTASHIYKYKTEFIHCESMNSLSHGITYLQVQDRVHSLWVNELTLPWHHISTSTRQSSFTVSQWTHSPMASHIYKYKTEFIHCESMNSLSHGITYLQVQDRVHSLWVNELTLPRHHISTSTRQSSFTVSQWTHSPMASHIYKYKTEFIHCESMNSLSHGITYLQVQDRVHSLWVNELTLPWHHISTSTRQSSFTVSQWTHSPTASHIYKYKTEFIHCESMNSLSHGITYLQVQDRVHSLWVNELTLPRHHISTSTRQSSFTVSQWTHSPTASHIYKYKTEFVQVIQDILIRTQFIAKIFLGI